MLCKDRRCPLRRGRTTALRTRARGRRAQCRLELGTGSLESEGRATCWRLPLQQEGKGQSRGRCIWDAGQVLVHIHDEVRGECDWYASSQSGAAARALIESRMGRSWPWRHGRWSSQGWGRRLSYDGLRWAGAAQNQIQHKEQTETKVARNTRHKTPHLHVLRRYGLPSRSMSDVMCVSRTRVDATRYASRILHSGPIRGAAHNMSVVIIRALDHHQRARPFFCNCRDCQCSLMPWMKSGRTILPRCKLCCPPPPSASSGSSTRKYAPSTKPS